MTWHPNRLQWLIVWVAVLISANVWLGLSVSDLWEPDAFGGWGLLPYLEPAEERPSQAAFTVLVIAGLLLWQASGFRKSDKQ